MVNRISDQPYSHPLPLFLPTLLPIYNLCRQELQNCFKTMSEVRKRKLSFEGTERETNMNFLEKDPILKKLQNMVQLDNFNEDRYRTCCWGNFIRTKSFPYAVFHSLTVLFNMNSQNYTYHLLSSGISKSVDVSETFIKNHFYWNSTRQLIRVCTETQSEYLIAMNRRLGKIFTIITVKDGTFMARQVQWLKNKGFIENKILEGHSKPKVCYKISMQFIEFVYQNEEGELQSKEVLKKINLPKVLENMVLDYIGYTPGSVTRHFYSQST